MPEDNYTAAPGRKQYVELKKHRAEIDHKLANHLRARVRESAEHPADLCPDGFDHFTDVAWIFRWLSDFRDWTAAKHVVELLPGTRPFVVESIMSELKKREHVFDDECDDECDDDCDDEGPFSIPLCVPLLAAKTWRAFVRMTQKVERNRGKWPDDLLLVLDWYVPRMTSLYHDAYARADELGDILNWEVSDRHEFLKEVAPLIYRDIPEW
jgi:hypothetical protein